MVVLEQLVDKIAHAVATIHSGNLNHGDLTTSNMMLRRQEDPTQNFIDISGAPALTKA